MTMSRRSPLERFSGVCTIDAAGDAFLGNGRRALGSVLMSMVFVSDELTVCMASACSHSLCALARAFAFAHKSWRFFVQKFFPGREIASR
jgi:hypothetical protein